MTTQYRINEASLLKNGLIAIAGSVIAGPRLVIGQEGMAVISEHWLRVTVAGTGVMDPNLSPAERQGILVKLLEGDIGMMKGLTLEFTECGERAD